MMFHLLAITCYLFAVTASTCAQLSAAPAARLDLIHQWAGDLDHDDYARREAAQRNLVEAGLPAVDVIAAAANRGGLEGRTRAMSILTSLLQADDVATYQSVKEALWEIARSANTSVAEKACQALGAENDTLAALMQKMEIGYDEQGRATSITNGVAPGEHGLLDQDIVRFKMFPDLTRLDLSGEVFANDGYVESRITDKGLARLKSFKKLTYLDLEGTQVTEAGLAHVEALTRLRTLKLSEKKITEKGLVYLRPLSQLETLDLSYTLVSDLRPLGEMPSLRTLIFSDAPVTEGGLEGFKGLSNLTELKMTFTRHGRNRFSRYVNTELLHLGHLTKLERLELTHSGVGDTGLAGLRDLVELRELNISYAPITDATLEHLQSLTKLERLELWITNITGSGLRHLQGLKNLRVLRIGSTLNTAEMQHLPPIPKLEELYAHFYGPDPPDQAFRGLKGMTNLRNLDFRPLTDGALAHLERLERLETLSCSKTVTDAGAKSLARMPGLRSLHLTETQVTDAGMSYLKPLLQLRELSLVKTRISDEGIKRIAGLSRINRLYLNGTAVTDAAIPYLERFSQLSILSIEGTRISEDGVRRLREKLPKCLIMATKPKPAKAG